MVTPLGRGLNGGDCPVKGGIIHIFKDYPVQGGIIHILNNTILTGLLAHWQRFAGPLASNVKSCAFLMMHFIIAEEGVYLCSSESLSAACAAWRGVKADCSFGPTNFHNGFSTLRSPVT